MVGWESRRAWSGPLSQRLMGSRPGATREQRRTFIAGVEVRGDGRSPEWAQSPWRSCETARMVRMRTEDLRRLEQQYPKTSGGSRSSANAFAEALGVHVPGVRALAAELWGDLDDTEGLFGIGWWFPEPGTQRRILIGDYLVMATESIETNLIEAQLHYLEALSAWDRENDFIARSVDYGDNGLAQVAMPPRTRGLDDLPRLLRDLHIVGFFRAVGSALDCLAASLIGALAIPKRIQRADLGGLRTSLSWKNLDPGSPEGQLWSPSLEALEVHADKDHPGWMAWALDYRNTLVHRARPVQLSSLLPRQTLHRHDRSVPFIRTEEIVLGPRDPRRSDIEVLQSGESPVLTEDLKITMPCVLERTIDACNTVSRLLVDARVARRASPSLLPQPRSQWPDVPSAPSSRFEGCRPGSEPFNPAMFTSGPDVVKRLAAASLFGTAAKDWLSFD